MITYKDDVLVNNFFFYVILNTPAVMPYSVTSTNIHTIYKTLAALDKLGALQQGCVIKVLLTVHGVVIWSYQLLYS